MSPAPPLPAPRLPSAFLVAALALAAGAPSACSSTPPLPGGPPPQFEPGRDFTLPGEAPVAAPPASPEAPAPAPAPGDPAGAPATDAPASTAPAGSGPSSWTSTAVEPAPLPPGAGDPVPADGRVGARHLLVMYAGSQRAPETVTRTKDEARKRAEECLAKAKAPGAAFEAVVAECTDEPFGAKRGGDLYTFPPHAMEPRFAKGVLDTRVGQLSEIVETPFGFHVILRTR